MSARPAPGAAAPGHDGTPVWYAAFGSNLATARFRTYLEGGPVPLAGGRVQAGARDPSPPADDVATVLPHRLFFARSSRTWSGGGVAFLDPGPLPGPPPAGDRIDERATRCRLWLITVGQFADVFAQENGLPAPPSAAELLAATRAPAGDTGATGDRGEPAPRPGPFHRERWYGQVVPLGSGPGGHPVLTFTAPTPLPAARPAHLSYLQVVGAGLLEAGDLDPGRAAHYLAGRDGNRGVIDPEALAAELEPVAERLARPYRRSP